MAVTTIALYASPPSSVCSTPYPSQINSHSSDFDLNSRSSSSTTTSQKSVIGGLSCLFSSPSAKHASPTGFAGDELGTLRHERNEDLSSSFSYSPYSSLSSSLKCRDQSPVSVFQGPVSCNASGTSRSPPGKTIAEQSGEVHLQASFRAHRDGLFSGFVRNALGSCIDYESPSFPISGLSHKEDSSVSLVDEFNFGAPEEDFGESCGPYSKELLLGAQTKNKVFYDEFVVKAFYEAERAHRGQMRASGDPYLQHCVETAVLLATIGASATVVAAGLLHDTLDDSFMNYEYIFRTFGAGIADLVEGVSKLSHLSKLARESNIASKTVEADRLHTMFLAMADARAVLIKLADRLHNMMTLEALPLIKRQRFAKETLEIFAPLANRLGISSWKEELENLCFKHLNPEQHEELSSELIESSDESKITSAVEKLKQALEDGEVSYHCLLGRHKSLYSTYRKMLKKKLTMDEIHDIHGLRLIVENKEDCYAALKIVHQLWPKVPGKLKDYIIHPKFNGYQSLHTVVMSEDMVPLEVQIRSKEMHLQAEFGFAAHWRYKEGDCKHSSFVLQMVKWARWVVSWQCENVSKERRSSFGADLISSSCSFPSHSDDCPYCYMPNCDQDSPIFVVMIENDKMSVQEFEANSTVMQLLERVGRGSSKWSPYGFPVKEELRPRLNHKPVSDSSLKLKMGDVVELTPAIPNKRLTKYREEFQRMYDQDLTASSRIIAWRS